MIPPKIKYVVEDNLNGALIRAAVADGLLEPWRVDGQGRQWYRSLPLVYGVPAEPVREEVPDAQ